MLDVLSKVRQSEESAQQILNDALQQAASIKADAQKQGKLLLDQAKSEASRLSEETIEKAKQDAQSQLENTRIASEFECSAMGEKSQQKLTAAANLIVERIVNTL